MQKSTTSNSAFFHSRGEELQRVARIRADDVLGPIFSREISRNPFVYLSISTAACCRR